MSTVATGKCFGFRPSPIPIETGTLPISEIDPPSVLSFPLTRVKGFTYSVSVKRGDEIEPGQPLAAAAGGAVQPSPVKGKVVAVGSCPDIRGGRQRSTVLVEPDPESTPVAFPPLDPLVTETATLLRRISEAGMISGTVEPKHLADILRAEENGSIETLIVLAVDSEPGVSAAVQTFRDRGEQAVQGALLLGRIAGATSIMLAVPDSLLREAEGLCRSTAVEPLAVPPLYPESLKPMVAARAGGGKTTRVVELESALAALEAVREGRIQDSKVLTFIGPGGRPLANYRVRIGTKISDILAHAGIEPGERDKIVAGGPMRGFAQYSTDAAIDSGIEALLVLPAAEVVEWTDEPCINCGGCIEACPADLQVQLIGRYAEFSQFHRTEELEIAECIECGLCATVCVARRPLLQLIRLAKHELAEQRGVIDRENAEERP